MALGIFSVAGSAIANAAKNLFSGAAKEARQERRAARQEAKETAKEAKETLKKAITGGGTAGAKAGKVFADLKNWFVKNWQMVAIVAGAILTVWLLFFRNKKKPAIRRRRTTGKGSAAMKARMAKVRAARARKRK